MTEYGLIECKPTSCPTRRVRLKEDRPNFSNPRKYCMEWYKNSNSFGLRRTYPGDRKQIFVTGGKTSRLAKELLQPLARKALHALSEEEVKVATLNELRALVHEHEKCLAFGFLFAIIDYMLS